ncbi:hypothetical protein C8J57DRAFT_1218467 [Mycena rebaudengoi]|nr:hypothetical protein C8J57DRAFT_1218467 [Mycena rebaudengoi]
MKSFALLSVLVPALFRSGNAWPNIRADASTMEIQDDQTGTLMVLPPLQTDTGTKRIPEIIRGTGELTRGNPFVNKTSIRGVSPFAPPLPGKIDGPKTQGIAKYGRVEGDASMTRADVSIGDNRNFNQTFFDMVLQQLAKFGDDGPDGPAAVFNVQTLIEIKRQNFDSDQALNPAFLLHESNFPRKLVPFSRSRFEDAHSRANFGGIVPRCINYWDQLSNGTPGNLPHVRGIFKKNVGILFNGSGCAEQIAPAGPTNV